MITDLSELMRCKNCKFWNGHSCSENHTKMEATSSVQPTENDSCIDWELGRKYE